VLAGAGRLRGDVLHLPRPAIEAGDLAAVNDVRIEWVRGDVAVLLDADGLPVAGGDLTRVAAADDAGRPALLLAAVDPVREAVVGDDVIELGGRLVVPTAP